jgi:bifunctional DNA-binding transcriptional regulator/antitoxin component of YhaV-PrlF toxin-antitoxin module
MGNRVGAKGNIVIDRAIREQLGVQPGWETVQLLREGRVEIYFLPPARAGASAGILGPAPDAPWLEDDERFHQAVETALDGALRQRFGSLASPETTSPEPEG